MEINKENNQQLSKLFTLVEDDLISRISKNYFSDSFLGENFFKYISIKTRSEEKNKNKNENYLKNINQK